MEYPYLSERSMRSCPQSCAALDEGALCRNSHVSPSRWIITPRRAVIIGVERTVPTATCQQCGRTIDTFSGYDRPIRLRHLPILGMVVCIEIRHRRG